MHMNSYMYMSQINGNNPLPYMAPVPAPQHAPHHLNAGNVYQMHHMPTYQQQHPHHQRFVPHHQPIHPHQHKQQQKQQQQQQQHSHQLSQSPPQRSPGYMSYYQQNTNRYYYNSMLNNAMRPPSPNQPNHTNGGGVNSRLNYKKNCHNNFKSQQQTQNFVYVNEMKDNPNPLQNSNKINFISCQNQGNSPFNHAQEEEDFQQSFPQLSNMTIQQARKNCTNNNKSQQLQKSAEKLETLIDKKSTTFNRSESTMSLVSNAVVADTNTEITSAAVDTKQLITDNTESTMNEGELANQNDTMQRNSSKASHTAAVLTPTPTTNTKSHQHQHNHHPNNTNANNKNHKYDSSDSGISNHNGQNHSNNNQSTAANANAASTVKQRKTRGGNKRHDAAANAHTTGNAPNSAQTSGGQHQQQQQQQHNKRSSPSNSFTVSDWLQSDMYCYERRRFNSSSGEDTRTTRHNPAHRNSTSSEAAASDDLNSSSSYEDHSSTYTLQTKGAAKKTTKSRQKRQQKRKQHLNNNNTTTSPSTANTNNSSTTTPNTTSLNTSNQHNNAANNSTAAQQQQQQPMDIDDDYKENRKPNKQQQQSSSTAALNLRKQCTKAAAIKAALNSSKLSKSQAANNLSTSASNSSVCSSLSAASSTTSISSSISSSATSTPNNSANSSPTASPTVTKRNADHFKQVAKAFDSPLRQFSKLNMNESQMAQQLREFILDPTHLQVYGFPVESAHHEGCIEIYKCLPKHMAEEAVTKDNQRHHHHFYGRKKINADGTKTDVINVYDGLPSSAQWLSSHTTDSGNGSGDSSPRFIDSDSSDMAEDDIPAQEPVMAFYTPDGVYQIFSEYVSSEEKQCVRCHKTFQVNAKGEYQTFDSCSYHWGKLSNVYNGKCFVNVHSCCQGEEFSEGCSTHHLHVWSGCVVGINGPFTDYVYTQPRPEGKQPKHPKIYAIDCEMSFTGLGLEVTKVTVVGYDGSLVYEHFVQPQAAIVDYNTRFSGITENDLNPDSNNCIKTFAQVQQDLLKLFDADTILIGHGLDNDLRVLRLVHKTIVDTSLVFSHSTGFPYRRSLKTLTKSYLRRDIQCSDKGHSSFEDSRACLELMMWKLRKDCLHWGSYQ